MAPAGEVVNSLSVLSLDSRTPDDTGAGQPVTAQLLLDAQERLREAFMPCSQPHAMPPTSVFCPQHIDSHPHQNDVQTAPLQQMLPTMPSLDSSTACTLLATPFMPIDQSPPACPPKTAAALAKLPPLPALPRECRSAAPASKRGAPGEAAALAEECMDESSSSEGNSHSSRSSGSGSKKRKRPACADAARADAWVGDLLLERRSLQARCDELEASNARLVCHLSLAVRMLQQERAAAQAEAHSLRQKCNALGAFLPPSVAAFARGIPPGSDLLTRKAMLREQAQP